MSAPLAFGARFFLSWRVLLGPVGCVATEGSCSQWKMEDTDAIAMCHAEAGLVGML